MAATYLIIFNGPSFAIIVSLLPILVFGNIVKIDFAGSLSYLSIAMVSGRR